MKNVFKNANLDTKNYCANCQLNISDPKSTIKHSLIARIKVCSLCGFPVEPKHRKMVGPVQVFNSIFDRVFPVLVASFLIFVFNLTWWVGVIIGILLFIIIPQFPPFTIFLFDGKIANKYEHMSEEDYLNLISNDDRLIHKRDMTVAFDDSIKRQEHHISNLEKNISLSNLVQEKIKKVGQVSKRGSFTESEYHAALAHMTKLRLPSYIIAPKIIANEIDNWTEHLDTANYLKGVDEFIEKASRHSFASTPLSNDSLNNLADSLNNDFEIVERESAESIKEIQLRFDSWEKLNEASAKLSKDLRILSGKYVFTNEEILHSINLTDEANILMNKYQLEQMQAEVNINFDSTYTEILEVKKIGTIVKYTNDFLPPENLTAFWTLVGEIKELISLGESRPNNFGTNQDLNYLDSKV